MNLKFADEVQSFLKGPIWSIVKYRLLEYSDRTNNLLASSIRNQDWYVVARLQGIIDGVCEIIRVTENLDKEIYKGNLDVDAALSVMENKARHKEE